MSKVYVSRTISVLCTAAPLVLFFLLLAGAEIGCMLEGHWFFFPLGLLLTFHLLGCRSDRNLLKALQKFKTTDILVLDAGTEQWIYCK